jgi:hypothetical protein
LKELLKLYIKLYYRLFIIISCLVFKKNFDWKKWAVRHLGLLRIYACYPSSVAVSAVRPWDRGCMLPQERGVTVIFYLESKRSMRAQSEIEKWLKTFQTILDCYSVILEWFYMVNPTPDVIKTIVNEVKNQPRTQDPKGQKERPWERGWSRISPRWRKAHLFRSKYFEN